jgi:DNA (cytosine-5)-methyltransferase 1
VRANGYQPKHPNLIPEFERIVAEAQPAWFLMEEVPAAPVPRVPGYSVCAFPLDNSTVDSGNGWGNEQRRKRVFSFGVLGDKPVDLRKWIDFALFVLPDIAPTLPTHGGVARMRALEQKDPGRKFRSGDRPGQRVAAVTTEMRATRDRPKMRQGSVLAGHGPVGRGRGYVNQITIEEACRLQGLPENFSAHMPFTQHGKREVIGNGVPLTLGRPLARAIQQNLASCVPSGEGVAK